MKRSRFSEEQIIGVLKQAESGRAISELIRELGITETNFYRWRRKFGGMEVSDARRKIEAWRRRTSAAAPKLARIPSCPDPAYFWRAGLNTGSRFSTKAFAPSSMLARMSTD